MSGEKIVSDVIAIINDGLNIGTFTFKDIADKLSLIAGCGLFLKDMIGILTPDRPDPVMLMLFELDRKINQLSDKMSWEFDSLKAFIVENEFYADLAQTASTLMKFMQDTINNPVKDSYEIFRDIAQKTPPLQYAYKMISLLEQESTNPLKMAMKADRLQSTATYDRWRTIIDAVITQFLFLETYINGMFWNKNMYGPNQLKTRIEKLNEQMDQWREEYKQSYWGNVVERLIYDTQDNHMDVGNEAKAQILQDSLGQVLTDDGFYFIVYNDCSGYERHAFYGVSDQYMVSFRRGKCNVAVYRSRDFNRTTDENRKQIEYDVESCRYNTISGNVSNKDQTKWLMENRIRNCRFVALISDWENVVVRNVNSPGYGFGPGWYITVQPPQRLCKYVLVAGYN
uniref:Endotoxin_N domain-containing protein n=1 Tax=Caenorhabditis tropicalis TaxID=1561998 RepID=A0A1I7UWL5_9PELO